MNIKEKLRELDLNAENSVVIGSGILNALNIRNSRDIDLVVSEEAYSRLSQDTRFQKSESNGREKLAYDVFDIGKGWYVLGKDWRLNDFAERSVVIDGIRYNSLEFLLEAKKSWLLGPSVRQKDIDDVKLMEDYIK